MIKYYFCTSSRYNKYRSTAVVCTVVGRLASSLLWDRQTEVFLLPPPLRCQRLHRGICPGSRALIDGPERRGAVGDEEGADSSS